MNEAEAAALLRRWGVPPSDLEQLAPLVEALALSEDKEALREGLASFCPAEVARYIADEPERLQRIKSVLEKLIALDVERRSGKLLNRG